jgi:Fe2+ transport system protein FeoA
LLAPYRDKEVRLLEIGVNRGNSLRIWNDAFLNATSIVGIDINPECKQNASNMKTLQTHFG